MGAVSALPHVPYCYQPSPGHHAHVLHDNLPDQLADQDAGHVAYQKLILKPDRDQLVMLLILPDQHHSPTLTDKLAEMTHQVARQEMLSLINLSAIHLLPWHSIFQTHCMLRRLDTTFCLPFQTVSSFECLL